MLISVDGGKPVNNLERNSRTKDESRQQLYIMTQGPRFEPE